MCLDQSSTAVHQLHFLICKKKAFCLQCSHYEAVKWQFVMVMMLFPSGSSSLIQAYVTQAVQLEVSTLHFWTSIKNSRNVTVKMKPNEIFEHINYSLLVFFLYLGFSVSILQENSAKVLPGGPSNIFDVTLIWHTFQVLLVSVIELNG